MKADPWEPPGPSALGLAVPARVQDPCPPETAQALSAERRYLWAPTPTSAAAQLPQRPSGGMWPWPLLLAGRTAPEHLTHCLATLRDCGSFPGPATAMLAGSEVRPLPWALRSPLDRRPIPCTGGPTLCTKTRAGSRAADGGREVGGGRQGKRGGKGWGR